ncbi:MAG: plasmid mobilization relaxosome protein MobC [Hyphomicrobiaceae bacterium]
MQRRARKSDDRRTQTITFRVSSEERRRLDEAAIEAGMTLSAYVAATVDRRTSELRRRLAGMQKAATPPPPPSPNIPPEVVYELRRIGNNVNQIAHAVNSGLPPDIRHYGKQLLLILQVIETHGLDPRTVEDGNLKAPGNDSPPSQTRAEFQRSVHLYPSRSWRDFRPPRPVDPKRQS